MHSETKRITINNTRYRIKIEESKHRKAVYVYVNRRNKIVETVKYRGRFLWFGRDNTPPIENMVQSTLNEVVCIYENKKHKQDMFEGKIGQAISNTKEVHEEEVE